MMQISFQNGFSGILIQRLAKVLRQGRFRSAKVQTFLNVTYGVQDKNDQKWPKKDPDRWNRFTSTRNRKFDKK